MLNSKLWYWRDLSTFTRIQHSLRKSLMLLTKASIFTLTSSLTQFFFTALYRCLTATSVGQESSMWNFSHGSGKLLAFFMASCQLKWCCRRFDGRALFSPWFFWKLAKSESLLSLLSVISVTATSSSKSDPTSSFQSCDVWSHLDSLL